MGRLPTGKVPEQQLQLVRPIHREIMRRLVCGEKPVAIARDLELSQSRLSIVMNSPLFMAEFKKLEENVTESVVDNLSDVDKRLRVLAPNAVEVINSIMITRKTPLPLKRACARDILDLVKQSNRDMAERQQNNSNSAYDLGEIISSAWEVGQAAKEEGRREARAELQKIMDEANTTEVDAMEVEEVEYREVPEAKAVNE